MIEICTHSHRLMIDSREQKLTLSPHSTCSIFQQRFKERLGAQWAHITSQPEVEEAIKRVQDMYDYFEALEKIVRKQKVALEKVNDIESELSLWYRKEGYVFCLFI